jgi:two-component system CheB/CheR fusion protein
MGMAEQEYTGDPTPATPEEHLSGATPRIGESYLQQIWETTTDALALSDAEGIVLDANPAYLRLYGYSLEQVKGKCFAIIFPEEARQWAEEQYQIVFAAEDAPPPFETRVLRADGSHRIVESRATFLTTAGKRTAMLSTIRDITAHKQAQDALRASEERLRQLNETLESRVEERTEQVRSLVTQLAMSEQAERRRISQILHDDLQQRLYAMNVQGTTARYALAGEDRATIQQLLLDIEEAIDKAIQLTRELSVDFSPPLLQVEGFTSALDWLASQMQQQHGLVVTLQAVEPLPSLHEDLRVMLFHIVRELLFNIVKHAGVNTAQIEIGFDEGQLRIDVSDEGRGFTSAQAPQTSQGLLRIGQRLQLIGGHMQIDSRAGEGTRVSLYVPLRTGS